MEAECGSDVCGCASQGGGDVVATHSFPGVATPDGGKQGVCGDIFVAEGKDEAANNGDGFSNGVTHASVSHVLAFDPIILVVEREGDEGGLCDLPVSTIESVEAAGSNTITLSYNGGRASLCFRQSAWVIYGFTN